MGLLRNTCKRIRREGVLATLRMAGRRLRAVAFDWWLGVETREEVSREHLGYGADWHPYNVTDRMGFRRVMKRVRIRPAGEDVFLDYGSGKGRVLLMAAQFAFRRVIGVEYSEELNRVARRNIERAGRRCVCKEIEVVTADAAEFRVPPGRDRHLCLQPVQR